MIVVDTNILVYAYRRESPRHEPARELLRQLLNGSEPWAICWPSVHEFLATVTSNKMNPPTPVEEAFAAVVYWSASASLRFLGEAADHLDQLHGLLTADVRGGKIHDARIAAICLSHGATELWTLDRDFAHFPVLRTRNPFESAA